MTVGNDYGEALDAAAIDPLRVLAALREMPPDQLVEPGVTAGDALEVMTTPPAPPGMVHAEDQVYGTAGAGGRPLTMHLYRPADPGERRPGVVFIHGGGFQEGFPEMLVRYAGHLAAAGYVTASIRYRLSGEAAFPANVEDAKCAVRWMRAHAHEIGLDPARIGVAGNSAGGHLAAMVANTPGRFEGSGGWGTVDSGVSAAALLYPGVDLRPSTATDTVRVLTAKLLRLSDLTEEAAAQASPVTYLGPDTPPTLTISGAVDPIVHVDPLRHYHDRLTQAGIANELVIVPDVGHSFDFSLARWNECFARFRAWFDHHL